MISLTLLKRLLKLIFEYYFWFLKNMGKRKYRGIVKEKKMKEKKKIKLNELFLYIS